MILSASRRTDIPARYAEWFMNRIRAGQVLTRNPMNHAQLSRIPLSPEIVDGIVFWTKDPQPLIAHLPELDRLGCAYYFQFTLTPYGTDLEPNLRPKPDIQSTFIALARQIGRERVVWRYDPIILTDRYTLAFHRQHFAALCESLHASTDTVVISFVDGYAKLKAPPFRPITASEIAELCGFIAETATSHGIRAVSCCENGLSAYGIGRSSCIDKARLERITGCVLEVKPDKNQREGCGCDASIDIGVYNTCPNGCVYCYANRSHESAANRCAAHDPNSAILSGPIGDGKITDRICRSNKCGQMRFFE